MKLPWPFSGGAERRARSRRCQSDDVGRYCKRDIAIVRIEPEPRSSAPGDQATPHSRPAPPPRPARRPSLPVRDAACYQNPHHDSTRPTAARYRNQGHSQVPIMSITRTRDRVRYRHVVSGTALRHVWRAVAWVFRVRLRVTPRPSRKGSLFGRRLGALPTSPEATHPSVGDVDDSGGLWSTLPTSPQLRPSLPPPRRLGRQSHRSVPCHRQPSTRITRRPSPGPELTTVTERPPSPR